MVWNEAIHGFETHLFAAGKSTHTISAFRRDLNRFAISQDKQPEEITASDLDVFLAGQQIKPDGAPRSPNSLNRLRTALRVFFGWMQESGEIETNPAASIRTTGVTQKPPVYLTEQEERNLLRCLRDNRTKAHALRDAAIIHLLLDTGIRVGELVGLNVDDIDGKHLVCVERKVGTPLSSFFQFEPAKSSTRISNVNAGNF